MKLSYLVKKKYVQQRFNITIALFFLLNLGLIVNISTLLQILPILESWGTMIFIMLIILNILISRKMSWWIFLLGHYFLRLMHLVDHKLSTNQDRSLLKPSWIALKTIIKRYQSFKAQYIHYQSPWLNALIAPVYIIVGQFLSNIYHFSLITFIILLFIIGLITTECFSIFYIFACLIYKRHSQ